MAWVDMLFGGLDILYVIMWWVLGLAIFGGIILFVMLQIGYKHTVVIREIVQGRERIIQDKAKTIKDKKGTFWWKLQKERDKEKRLLPVPPEKAIDITNKGKYHCECWRYPTGHIIWIESQNNIDNAEATEETLPGGTKEFKIIENSFAPLNNNDRAVIVNQIMKAEQNKRRTLQELVLPIAYILSITIIIVCFMVFAEDMYAPAIKNKEIATQQISLMNEMSKRTERIEQGIQYMTGEEEDIPT